MNVVTSPLPTPPSPDPASVQQIIRFLQQAERPLIVAGGGVLWSQATEWLQRFAEMVHVPVVATWLRNDVFPNNHPLYAGSIGSVSSPENQELLRQADALLAIGVRFSEFSTNRYRAMRNVPIIHIDIAGEQIGKIYPVHLGVVADAGLALQALCRELEHNAEEHFLPLSRREWVEQARRGFVTASLEPVEDSGKLTPLAVIRAMEKVLEPDAALVFDSGSFTHWFSRFYCWRHPNTLFGTAGGAMGFGLPAGLGVKLANPEQQVVSVVGDGGFMMTLQELETAVRHRISTMTIVMNNFSYAQIKAKQQLLYPERVKGNDLLNPDFARLAELFGAAGYRVQNADELEHVLTKAVAERDRPVVVDVHLDPTVIWPPGESL